MEKRQGRASAKYVVGLIIIIDLLLICPLQEAQGSVQHQVGGPPGWSLPSRSNVNYTTWASTQNFTVGDTLYFNYSSAFHNVLQVTEANYKSCDASNPVAQWDDGATIILLNSSGTSYYICGIPGHCDAGQKVAVLVTGQQHQVGGTPGWSLPSRSGVNYTEWASTQTFHVGDTLYFNYSSAFHNVLEVTEANYKSCDASNPIAQWDDGATIILLNSSGMSYYICGIPGHCDAGQKVAVLVAGEQHQVGGTPGWSLPSRSGVNYTEWASTQTFDVGDTLYFNYSKQFHNVLQVTEAQYNECDASSAIAKWDDGATIIQLNETGTFYYICGITGHCGLGQKVAVLVEGASSSSSTATSPTIPSPLPPTPSPASVPPVSLSPSALRRLSPLLTLSLIFLLLLP